jgi:hypothetical protein
MISAASIPRAAAIGHRAGLSVCGLRKVTGRITTGARRDGRGPAVAYRSIIKRQKRSSAQP